MIRGDQKVLVRWIREGARIENGRAEPRSPGDEDVIRWDKIKGVIAIGRCVLVSEHPQIPVIE